MSLTGLGHLGWVSMPRITPREDGPTEGG
jgi:hypothetical protein